MALNSAGFVLSTGLAAASLVGLIRNIVIARMLGAEEFGIAATFAITYSFIEMTSNLAINRLIVQDKNGDQKSVQDTLHTIQIIRGLFGFFTILIFADLISMLFGLPHLKWGFQIISLVPLIRGFLHLDIYRSQRDYNFKPLIICEILSQIIATISAIILALYLQDYRSLLFAIIIQQLTILIISHAFSERRFHLSWEISVAYRAINFGWPLLLNGLIMFLIFQGDRIIVGNQMGVEALGWFSAAFMVTLTPTILLARILNTYFLPKLAKLQDQQEEFEDMAVTTLEVVYFVSLIFLTGFIVVGKPIFAVLFGPDFYQALAILILLAGMQTIRLGRTGASIIAVARADTRNPLFSNLVRLSVIPIGAYSIYFFQDVAFLVWIALFGEALSTITSVILLNKNNIIKTNETRTGLILFLFTVFLFTIFHEFFYYICDLYFFSYIFYSIFIFCFMLFMPNLRRFIFNYLRQIFDPRHRNV